MTLPALSHPKGIKARLLISQAATGDKPDLCKPPSAETECPSAFNFRMPCCRIFPAALISLSCIAPQEQTHDRIFKDISACFKPQQEQVFVDGNHWSILTRCFPSCLALYSILVISVDQPASEMALASRLFLTMFLTLPGRPPAFPQSPLGFRRGRPGNELSGKFVLEVIAGIGHPFMRLCQL